MSHLLQLSNNTHHYDGHLKGKYQPSETIFNLSVQEKILKITNFEEQIKDHPFAFQAFNLIKNNSNNSNYDGANNINALDLLLDIILLLENSKDKSEILPTLKEQLGDIILSGPCAQGRTTRLFQIWLCVKD